MDWSHLQHKIPFEKNFRWRGGQVSRIEAFSDAVFALSVTLLVVSTETPSSYAELVGLLQVFPAFAAGFALIMLVWFFHFIHFRRYGLEDGTTMWLNLVLLFVVMYYAYPLKLMVAFLYQWVISDVATAAGTFELNVVSAGRLLAIYGVGFVLMYVILALLTLHALRLRDELELNEVEVVLTRSQLVMHGIMVFVGTLSVALALLLSPFWGGFAYMLLPVLHPIHGVITTRKEKAACERMSAPPAVLSEEEATAAAQAAEAVSERGATAAAQAAKTVSEQDTNIAAPATDRNPEIESYEPTATSDLDRRDG